MFFCGFGATARCTRGLLIRQKRAKLGSTVRSGLCSLGLDCGCGATRLSSAVTHTHTHPGMPVVQALTFVSCCRCGSSHLKPRCPSSPPRGELRPGNSATPANGIYFLPMSCSANNSRATVPGSALSGERALRLPGRGACPDRAQGRVQTEGEALKQCRTSL